VEMLRPWLWGSRLPRNAAGVLRDCVEGSVADDVLPERRDAAWTARAGRCCGRSGGLRLLECVGCCCPRGGFAGRGGASCQQGGAAAIGERHAGGLLWCCCRGCRAPGCGGCRGGENGCYCGLSLLLGLSSNVKGHGLEEDPGVLAAGCVGRRNGLGKRLGLGLIFRII